MKQHNPIAATARVEGDAVRIDLVIPVETATTGPPTEAAKPPDGPRHSVDFASYVWHDCTFTFTPIQRCIVQCLHEAHQNGTPFVSQACLLETADSCCTRLRDLFRKNSAWGTLIQQGLLHGGPAGTFCLVDPERLKIAI